MTPKMYLDKDGKWAIDMRDAPDWIREARKTVPNWLDEEEVP